MLDDVMVVAYGVIKKSSFTGSAATVDRKSIEKVQSSNFTSALQGAVAGVQVLTSDGQPGSSASIRIRGIGSVNASNKPLYVVDGAAYDGDINAISTDDIESMTVLKDAAASALYGARGANGVIIITTRKGTSGETRVSAKVNIGVTSRAIPEYDRVNSQQYYELQWESWRNALTGQGKSTTEANALASSDGADGIVKKLGGYNPFSVQDPAQLIGLDGKLNPSATLLYYDDWNKELEQLGLRQDYGVNISGGAENSTYYASVNYLGEKGHVKWSDYERFTARVGVNSKVTDWFKTEVGISGSTSEQAGFLAEGTYTTNPFYYGRVMGPIYPIWQRDESGNILTLSDGTPKYDMGGGNSQYTWSGHTRPYAPNSNLLLTLPLDYRGNTKNQVSARVAGDVNFLKDFTFRVSASTDISNMLETTYQNNQYGDAVGVNGRSTKEYSKTFSYTFNQVLSYNKTFGEHSISALLGHENYNLTANNLWATRTGFKVDTNELVAGAIAEGSSSYSNYYTLEGYFTQLNYSFANKYFLSGSYRYDGTSRFSQEARWGGFWSVGASWRIIEEDFMESISWINDLKLKASYGEQGNDAILDSDDDPNYYGYQGLFSIDDKNNGNLNGAIYSQIPAPELAWEKNSNLNVGLDFAFFNSRLRGGVEYFTRTSDNLLFEVPIPQSSGLSSKWANIGTMVNKGIELQLSGDIIVKNNFKWTMDFNLTHYTNEITKMPTDLDGNYQEIVTGTKKLSVGHSIYDFWLRDYAGVDKENGDALYYKDIKDADGNITGKETTNDMNAATFYYVGASAIPTIYGGFNNTFSFYGFDLSVFLTYQIGGQMYDGNYQTLMSEGDFGQHMHSDILNRWTPENPNSDIPRLENGNPDIATTSSRFLVDASYLALRNITLGYSLPRKVVDKIGIQGLRIYATGDNLGLLSARKGMDPQRSFNGTADFTYIPTRIISLGLNLTF